MKTSIICILDRSGSMNHIMHEAIGSFNGFIESQRKSEIPGEVDVTLYAFDDQVEKVFENVALNEVSELTLDHVRPRGMTGMYDAIGQAIVESTAKDAIVLIQTDGDENASRNFTSTAIKEMIKIKESMGWEFHFIGAGVDAITAGSRFGVKAQNCLNISASAKGMNDMNTYFNSTTALYRSSKAPTPADLSIIK